MTQFETGDIVYARLGTCPLVGTVTCKDDETGKYLIRFSAVQQDWYSAEDIVAYKRD